MKKKCVLTIAGSDSGAGAGIQSDLKTFRNHDLFGLNVITSITAQNTLGVQSSYELPVKVIEAQLKSVSDDFDIRFVKTGMLSSERIVKSVSKFLYKRKVKLIVDPVILSKNNYSLLSKVGIEVLKKELIPLSYLVTPNLAEAEILSGLKIKSAKDINFALKKIHSLGCSNVLLKGGHFDERICIEKGTDILFNGNKFEVFKSKFINTKHTHGIGCTFSSAIVSNLANGFSLRESIVRSKKYISDKLKSNQRVGKGISPVEL